MDWFIAGMGWCLGFVLGFVAGMEVCGRLMRWDYGNKARMWQASSERAWADREYWQRAYYQELRRFDDSGEEWKRGIQGEHE